ncbi:tRNA (N6-isopentenyl adenosine(37)-C2)-methylthiotransferase MiaB [Saprospira grandis]|uniref:tRNA-2-methylthio-N(6)-dimethylallyladenosine synthase n=1 Tax=Saprospira grandis (strain Lewin) TaxID=984262 RepID=H6L5L0_SAPGL|nr:tRNA (N6-isopentenyl adenosine(37)-C2)-methylthiotransferase MiaB [Saprospira grandis]AFC25226.1 (dimethylallyl)adenosine tRNA methylthiotransferase [Saprospira grandis str. Lewin]
MKLYNDNPTLDKKMLPEDKQGDVFFKEQLQAQQQDGQKRFYIESYGCQMNFSDSEIVASILQEAGYASTKYMDAADLILVNTCSIREKAEDTVRKRLRIFDKLKKERPGLLVGVLGCMAERLKAKLLDEEKLVDLVLGPDAYRDLPNLIATAEDGDKGINVFLSREETYADISPVRLSDSGVTAFVTIMRGCDNMCSFCVVPFTRGRERSRDPYSILAECQDLFDRGFREVTLLGQNVDSYHWEHPEGLEQVDFADLLEKTALIHPDLRIRFSTSHPKDITDKVLINMGKYENICEYIHFPVQSGSSRILKKMNRTYDREWYMNKIDRIYELLPNCAVSSDVIAGFCTETEEDHQDTLSIIEHSQYSMSYMFFYSERPGTLAARKYEDDVPLEVKKRRLQEIIRLQNQISFAHNKKDIGKTFKVLIEKVSKRSEDDFAGRNSQNKMIVFPRENTEIGQYVYVKVTDCTQATLRGHLVPAPAEA